MVTPNLSDITRRLRHQRVSHSYRYALAAALFQGMLAIVLFFTLRHAVSEKALTLWLGAMLATQGAWGAIVYTHRQTDRRFRYTPRWLLHHRVVTLSTALLWGFGPGVLLFPSGTAASQVWVVFSLIAVASSALLLQAANRGRGLLFILLVMGPLQLQLLNETGGGQYELVLALTAYTVLLLLIFLARNRELRQSAATEAENDQLLRERQAFRAYMSQAQQIARLANWELNLKSGVLHFSPEAYELFGIDPREALTRKSVVGVIYWEDRLPYLRALEAAIGGNAPLSRTFRIVCPNGTLHTIKETAELAFDDQGQAERMLGVMFDVTDQVTAESRSENAYLEFNRILTQMQDTYYRTDPTGRLTELSPSFERLLGYKPSECIGWQLGELYVQSGAGRHFVEDLHRGGGTLCNYEIEMRNNEGEIVWVSVNAQFVRGADDKTVGIEGTIRDISELKRAKKALHREKEQALVTLESIGDGVITTDRAGRVRYINPTAEKLLGIDGEAASGLAYEQVVHLVDERSGETLENLVQLCLAEDGAEPHVDEGMLIKSDESRFHLKVTAAPMRDDNRRVIGSVLVLHDITEVMGMAHQLSYQAKHDMLTGLYNRSVFEERVKGAIDSTLKEGDHHILLYMDLDQFKVVNDTCGHSAGDELLKQVATLMHGEMRESDLLARLGGDEFGVLLEHCPIEKGEEIATKILAAIREFRFAWEDKVFEIGISIGLVPITMESGDITQVLAAADSACYVAKDSGRNRYHTYQPDDDLVLQRRGEMQWVHRLSSAFDTDRFRLYAQPVAHVGDRLVSHYEILVRMVDERGKIIPPGAFIPAAERYNLMPTMDRWVIGTALRMLREAQGDLAFPPVECAINLSGQSLCDDRLLEYVVDLFDETGIPCESVSFEVTETAAVANLTRATRFISVLRGMGCSFALDDFGAGLSSFGYLRSMPVDYLKIDGAFVRDMVIDRVDRAMVESINEIGHIMGLKTIGEYAENEAILQALEDAGVDYAQGHGIAPPRLFSEILESETRSLRNERTAGVPMPLAAEE